MDDRPIIPLQLTPARRLDEVYRTVENRPLLTKAELEALYEPSINDARGDDTTSDLKRGLRRSHDGPPYKRFFFGSRGSGKSTEMSRVLEGLEGLYEGVRIDVTRDLNRLFQPQELVLAIALGLVREMDRVATLQRSQVDLGFETLYAIQEWFVEAEYTTTRVLEKSKEGKTETKSELSVLKRFIPFTVTVSGSVRASTSVREDLKEKRRSLYGDLIVRTNRLIFECNELLGACFGDRRTWCVLIEDTDKGTPDDVLRGLVYDNGQIFRDLDVPLICGLPIGLRFGAQGNELPLSCCQMYDTPVYEADLSSYETGRRSLRAALAKRVSPTLFEDAYQIERLIVASGGNLRTLFEMVAYASDRAAARREDGPDPEAGPIVGSDVTRAINQQRIAFRYALGEDVTGGSRITKEAKAKRLREVYERTAGSSEPDEVLNDLLGGRLVQAFNGEGRYAVHPLVIDLLKDNPLFNPDVKELKGGLLN